MTEQNVDQDKNAEEVEASVEKKTEDTVDEVAKGGHEEEEKGGHDEDEEEEEKGGHDEDEEKGKDKKKDQRKRFTRARIDKLMTAFQSLADVMKEVDAGSVDDLLAIATTQKQDDAAETQADDVAKDTQVEKSADVSDELQSRLDVIEKALEKFGAVSIPKSLGSDGAAISKKADRSIWKDIVGF